MTTQQEEPQRQEEYAIIHYYWSSRYGTGFSCHSKNHSFSLELKLNRGKKNGLITRSNRDDYEPARKMYVDGDFVRQMAARADEVRKMDVNNNKEAYDLAAKEIVEQVEKEFSAHRSWTNRRGGW